jgi:hypothetical protein
LKLEIFSDKVLLVINKKQFKINHNMRKTLAPVVHASNPSYSGDRDQEGHGSKPAQAKFCKTLS